jgi:hypothetical protein
MNPYRNLPDYAFWRRAVTNIAPDDFDPVTKTPFAIGTVDRVATAGSCFAQHISRTLSAEGFSYLITEPTPQTPGAENENYGVFPARFGNIYTVRQLLQLFQRAYHLYYPKDRYWTRDDGVFVDPFRPQIQKSGFSSVDTLQADREVHFAAVRKMFETCDIFIFTLGLTEGWVSTEDGAVFPIAPGVSAQGSGQYAFENFSIQSMVREFTKFVSKLRVLNPTVRLIITVSPVPLVATYEPRHVLLSTIYSKAALRVVAEKVTTSLENVVYFPSYEIITGPQARGRYYADDLREVTPEGVSHVMSVFKRHFLEPDTPDTPDTVPTKPSLKTPKLGEHRARLAKDYQIVCDEEALDA